MKKDWSISTNISATNNWDTVIMKMNIKDLYNGP